jgi:hypothetical protein
VRLIPSILALLVACSLAATATAAGPKHQVDRGVVQSVSASRIALRELDGGLVSIAVGPQTRVVLNGRAASLADIQPGFVAAVSHNGDGPATAIRAFGRVQAIVDSGVIVSRARRALTIRTGGGTTLSFRITSRTTIRWRGLLVRAAALRPGRFAQVAHTPGGEALRVVVRLRGPA